MDRQVSGYFMSHRFTHRFRFLVPGILGLGGAMQKLEGYLVWEVKQRLHDIQEVKEDIPVGYILQMHL